MLSLAIVVSGISIARSTLFAVVESGLRKDFGLILVVLGRPITFLGLIFVDFILDGIFF